MTPLPSLQQVRRTAQQARNDRDSATGRLLGAYRDQGDTRARERLVELYMPLVEMLARRHDRSGSEHDDLVQAGSIGLLNAIERYDPSRGDEFAAFAVPTIAGEIKRHLRDRTSTVRLPRRLQEAGARLPAARDELTARLGRAPTPNELADAVGVSGDELAQLESAANGRGSLDEAGADGASEADASDSRVVLAEAFRTLNDTERTIIYQRFLRERSRREVADELRMSQSALARQTTVALSKLRTELEDKAFERGAPAATAAESRSDPDSGQGGHPGRRRGRAEPPESGPGGAAPPESPTGGPAKERAGHSGRLMLRMPQSLHAELAEAAEHEEVSLNQFITNTLSAAMSLRKSGERAHAEQPAPRPPRWLPAAIVTNVVVVVIAGLIAVALLIVAWVHGW